MADDTELQWPKVIDRELARLHELISAGKEVGWATQMAERLIRIMTQPVIVRDSSGIDFK